MPPRSSSIFNSLPWNKGQGQSELPFLAGGFPRPVAIVAFSTVTMLAESEVPTLAFPITDGYELSYCG